MATGKHEYRATTFQHAADPGSCINDKPHEFRCIGMIGVPIPDDPSQIQIVNRYYCTHCLTMATVEDHKVPMGDMEAMTIGSKTGQIQ